MKKELNPNVLYTSPKKLNFPPNKILPIATKIERKKINLC